VSESRQQRRARERAERKNAGRGARSAGVGPVRRSVRGYTVEVHRHEFDEQDEDDGVWWGAEAGLTNDSVGYDHESREDLAELLAEVVEDARERWGSRYDLRLEWTLTGDLGDPPVSLAAAAAAAGFELPDRVGGP
jgi:hypothetical protein